MTSMISRFGTYLIKPFPYSLPLLYSVLVHWLQRLYHKTKYARPLSVISVARHRTSGQALTLEQHLDQSEERKHAMSKFVAAGTTTLVAFILVESSFMVMSDFTIFISIFAVGMILLFASVAPTSEQLFSSRSPCLSPPLSVSNEDALCKRTREVMLGCRAHHKTTRVDLAGGYCQQPVASAC